MTNGIDKSGLAYETNEVTAGYENSGLAKDHKGCKAYSTVIGGFIYMIFPGSVYCTGVFSSYIQSYYGISSDKSIGA